MNFFQKFDRLEVQRRSNRKIYFSIFMGIFGMIFLTIGGSYAYLTYTVTGEKINHIQAGTLVLNFDSEGNSLTMTKAVPQADSVALANNTPYTFKITNTGTINAKYSISLNNICVTTSSYLVGDTLVTPDVCVPLTYVKAGIKVGNEAYQIVNLSDTTELLKDVTIDAKATSETISVKLWLDGTTPNDYQSIDKNGNERDVLFVGGLELYGEQATTSLPDEA